MENPFTISYNPTIEGIPEGDLTKVMVCPALLTLPLSSSILSVEDGSTPTYYSPIE